MKRTSVLLFLAAACSRPSAEKKLGSLDSTFAVVCGTPSDSVPFTRVDLASTRTTPTKQYAQTRELIQTAAEWKERWTAFGDSAAAPSLNFQDSIVVVVASDVFQSPSTVEIEGVRRCVGTDDIVIPVRIHTGGAETKQPERSLRAVQIARSDWKNQRVTFVDMPATSATR
jgi:hypothetical protein